MSRQAAPTAKAPTKRPSFLFLSFNLKATGTKPKSQGLAFAKTLDFSTWWLEMAAERQPTNQSHEAQCRSPGASGAS